MNSLEAFWTAIKDEARLAAGSTAAFKSNFQTWLNITLIRYMDFNTETLRAFALKFTLTRREFATLVNAYLVDVGGSNIRTSIEICSRCNQLEWAHFQLAYRGPQGSARACSRCIRNYTRACDYCGNRYEIADDSSVHGLISIYNVGNYCESCRTHNGMTVETCEGCRRNYQGNRNQTYLYRIEGHEFVDDEQGTHRFCTRCRAPEHSRCKPKTLEFRFPALNLSREDKSVAQDEVVEIATGGGDVSMTGMTEIRNLISLKTRGNSPNALNVQELILPEFGFDNRWMTREGNMPKRIAKLLVSNYHLKLTDDLMSEIGNIAQRYTSKPGSYRLSITRDVNRPRQEFVNGDSCWWTSYWWSRCNLKSLGGFGLRTWATRGSQGYLERAEEEIPVGRAWMIPLKSATALHIRNYGDLLVPAPDMLPAEAYIVFNGYGPSNSRLDSIEFGRMVASMTGKSYRKITFSVNHHLMYINGTTQGADGVGHGVLVAQQELCDQIKSLAIRSMPKDRCTCPGKPA